MNQYLTPHVKRGALYAAIVGIVLGVIGVIPVLNCIALPVLCIVGLGLPVVIGWFVAQWGGATDMGKGAVDGAIASALGALVSGVVVFVANLILSVVFSAIGAGLGGDAGSAAAGFAVGAVADFFSRVIVGPIGAAIFGAIGGLLYVAIQGNKAKPA